MPTVRSSVPVQAHAYSPWVVGLITTRPIQAFNHRYRRTFMYFRTTLSAAAAAIILLTTAGCAVTRGQESVGAYVDDSAITTAIKGRYVGNKEVDATSISVETLNGTVMLSGFAKSGTEKTMAETLAWKVNGVKSVKNEVAIRP